MWAVAQTVGKACKKGNLETLLQICIKKSGKVTQTATCMSYILIPEGKRWGNLERVCSQEMFCKCILDQLTIKQFLESFIVPKSKSGPNFGTSFPEQNIQYLVKK